MALRTSTPTLDLFDLFDLSPQAGPVHELPGTMASGDCTDDTCTNTCATSCGCGDDD
ncbi:hypothetical protein ACFOY2_53280 [Nonomuraea purpurea]|uniref:FxLD family lantipeptide n=1 Tax=Nonomuraea purpurea TaxID=1849276 RepID=A0ABV8GPZ3_9ACTN